MGLTSAEPLRFRGDSVVQLDQSQTLPLPLLGHGGVSLLCAGGAVDGLLGIDGGPHGVRRHMRGRHRLARPEEQEASGNGQCGGKGCQHRVEYDIRSGAIGKHASRRIFSS